MREGRCVISVRPGLPALRLWLLDYAFGGGERLTFAFCPDTHPVHHMRLSEGPQTVHCSGLRGLNRLTGLAC